MSKDIHYKIGGREIYNPYLAHYLAYKMGFKPVFCCEEPAYDALNWAVEPSESFEELMDAHALSLRAKYQHLTLNWSGGTDSQTIYNVFNRNKIHLDKICVKFGVADDEFFPKRHADWLVANHWDKATAIEVQDIQQPDSISLAFKKEDWVLDNVGDFRRFGLSGVSVTDVSRQQDVLGGDGWAIIAGFEKPRVVSSNGFWFSSMPDYTLRAAMGQSNLESFFMSPKIHLKQSHMLKNFMKAHPLPAGIREYDYYVESAATGRHDELSLGVSLGQKLRNKRMQKNVLVDAKGSAKSFATTDSFLRDRLLSDDSTATAYVNGLYSIRSDTGFWQYLNDNWFTHKDAMWSMKPLWSKPYSLGA